MAIRILIAVNIPYPEGRANTRRILTIARELVRQGHEVRLLLPFSRIRQPPQQVVDGIQVCICYVPNANSQAVNAAGRVRLRVHIISRLKWLKALWRESRLRSYDWLYLYQPGIDSAGAVAVARMFARKVVCEFVDALTPAGYSTRFLRVIYPLQVLADRILPRKADLVIVISTVLRRQYQGRAPSVPVLIVPTLVDIDRFGAGDPQRFRQSLGIEDRLTVVFTGSFVRTEGLSILCAAFSTVSTVRPEARLLIAGASLVPDSDDIEVLFGKYQLQGRAHYLGMLSESDVIDLQACADVLVMPKTDDVVNHAGLGTKLGEYLASGNAVVASDVGDVSRYLVHRKDALLVPPGQPEGLSAAILLLLDDPVMRAEIGGRGRVAAQRHFSVDHNVGRIAHSLIGASRG
jgi:glycosyltransferase involved in cell wall biosynthesis